MVKLNNQLSQIPSETICTHKKNNDKKRKQRKTLWRDRKFQTRFSRMCLEMSMQLKEFILNWKKMWKLKMVTSLSVYILLFHLKWRKMWKLITVTLLMQKMVSEMDYTYTTCSFFIYKHMLKPFLFPILPLLNM